MENKIYTKKLSNLQKWYLKYTNRAAYKDYKVQASNIKFIKKTGAINHPPLIELNKSESNFLHSGNSGDVIYSLPAVYELSKKGKANYYLQSGQKGIYEAFHPLGGVMLNDKMISMLIPLLEYQPEINFCKKYEGEEIDVDLDSFRNYSILLDRGNIVRWYFYVFGISRNTSLPWLTAPTETFYKNSIVIARSHRYRLPLIDYSFLNKYENIFFVGVEEEYNDMKKYIPKIIFKQVTNFLEMATIINSCKLFIGNQSFPFSIAEGLKVNRLLEVCFKCPNVIVEGNGANDFMYQPQFEYSVARLMA